MINIFFPGAALEASSVNAIVLGSLLVESRCPVVGKFGKLILPSSREILERGPKVFPIDIVKGRVAPIIMMMRRLLSRGVVAVVET